jgi:carboxylesterase
MIQHTSEEIEEIHAPTLVLQGKLDDSLYQESAPYIYDTVETEDKEIIWYQNSGHIITLGKERDKVYEDVLHFLDELDWSKGAKDKKLHA